MENLRRYRMNKKGLATWATVCLIIGFAVIVGFTANYLYNSGKAQTAMAQQYVSPKDPSKITVTPQSSFCSQNPTITPYIRAPDALTVSANYRNATFYAVRSDGILKEGNLDSTSSTRVSPFSLDCGWEYDIYPKTDNQSTEDIGPVSIEPLHILAGAGGDTSPEYDIKVVQLDGLQARVWDDLESAWMYANLSDQASQSTGYLALSDGGINWTNTTTSWNATGKNVASGDEYIVKIYVKTNEADKQCGTNTLVGVNYMDENNVNDWQKPSIRFNGKEMTDTLGSLSSHDISGWSGYENVYNLGKPIGESYDIVELSTKTGSGVTPCFNMTLNFKCTGIIESSANPGTLLGIEGKTKNLATFLDDTTYAPIYTTDAKDYIVRLVVNSGGNRVVE